MKKIIPVLMSASLLAGVCSIPALADETEAQAQSNLIPFPAATLDGWAEDSAALEKITAFVDDVTDESSEHYVAPEDRIATFDFDGTLYGERFPTYFDHILLVHRVLYDDSCTPDEDTRIYALSTENAMEHGRKMPGGSGPYLANSLKGLTIEEYQDCVRDVMAIPAWGFENMTYGEGFFQPMISVVRYLAEHDFQVYISSGSDRQMLRTLIEGTLDQWIPSDHVIGSTYLLTADGQGEEADRDYNMTYDDRILLSGELGGKNLAVGKVYGIMNEIGKAPILAFGNSSGDLSMAEYAVENNGKAFLLLCDDTERDYGDENVAAKFAAQCEELGLETVSMKNDFATIYGEDVVKSETPALNLAA